MMKSPFTGKEMKQVWEKRTWNFRNEPYTYWHTAWVDKTSGEQFTTDESDAAGYLQVTNQYREKYGIPYTDDIIALRKRYGLTAAMMSRILGIGPNQYRLYEQGEVPSISNGKLILSISNPKVMREMVESSKNELSPSDYARLLKKIDLVIADSVTYKQTTWDSQRIFTQLRGRANGYAPTSLSHLKNVLLYILKQCNDVWITKMNKLLFYTDFASYRDRGQAITGLSYKAISFGPVPERWDRVYSEFPEISEELYQSGDFEGCQLHALSPADTDELSEAERKVIDIVCKRFGPCTSHQISEMSHHETAWTEHLSDHSPIPFDAAFSIKAI